MKKRKIIALFICLLGAVIGGVFLRPVLDSAGITEPRTIVNESGYEVIVVENPDGSTTITVKPKGGR